MSSATSSSTCPVRPPSLEKFVTGGATSWNDFFDKFQIYARLAPIPPNDKPGHLILLLDEAAYNALITSAAPRRPDELGLDEINGLLKAHYHGIPQSIVAKCCRFCQRNSQQRDKSMEREPRLGLNNTGETQWSSQDVPQCHSRPLSQRNFSQQVGQNTRRSGHTNQKQHAYEKQRPAEMVEVPRGIKPTANGGTDDDQCSRQVKPG